jgi:predicted DCC family thiol-disulfide oxidoreductase YuxK
MCINSHQIILDKVYYNSACPICNAGIKNQRKRMEICGFKNIKWIDVHTNPETLSEIDISLNQVREKLYIKDLNGQLNVGVDAFICLWSQTSEQHWLAKLLRFPILNQFAHWMYNFFAKFLYHWNCSKRYW